MNIEDVKIVADSAADVLNIEHVAYASAPLIIRTTQKEYIDTIVSQIASIGSWSFVGSDMTKVLCDASYVKDAYVTANPTGGFGITLEFNEKGKGEFFANTASYATSGSSFYLMLDGQFAAVANITDKTVRDTFTFGAYEYQSASIIASTIKNGELPAEVHIEKTETLAPSLNKGVLTAIAIVSALIVIVAAVLLLIKGRSAGIFAVFLIYMSAQFRRVCKETAY